MFISDRTKGYGSQLKGTFDTSRIFWGLWDTGIDWTEKLWVLQPWKCSRLVWMGLWAAWPSERSLLTLGSFPTQTVSCVSGGDFFFFSYALFVSCVPNSLLNFSATHKYDSLGNDLNLSIWMVGDLDYWVRQDLVLFALSLLLYGLHQLKTKRNRY